MPLLGQGSGRYPAKSLQVDLAESLIKCAKKHLTAKIAKSAEKNKMEISAFSARSVVEFQGYQLI